MARRPSTHPTDAELEVLQILWKTGPTGLNEIHSALNRQRGVAKTTVATLLGVMLKKKLVRRTGGVRDYVWSAAADRTDIIDSRTGDIPGGALPGAAPYPEIRYHSRAAVRGAGRNPLLIRFLR